MMTKFILLVLLVMILQDAVKPFHINKMKLNPKTGIGQ